MKVKAIYALSGSYGFKQQGEVWEVSDELGRELYKKGLVDIVMEKIPANRKGPEPKSAAVELETKEVKDTTELEAKVSEAKATSDAKEDKSAKLTKEDKTNLKTKDK